MTAPMISQDFDTGQRSPINEIGEAPNPSAEARSQFCFIGHEVKPNASGPVFSKIGPSSRLPLLDPVQTPSPEASTLITSIAGSGTRGTLTIDPRQRD